MPLLVGALAALTLEGTETQTTGTPSHLREASGIDKSDKSVKLCLVTGGSLSPLQGDRPAEERYNGHKSDKTATLRPPKLLQNNPT